MYFLFTFEKRVTNCMSKKCAKHFYSDVFVFYVPFGQAQRSKERSPQLKVTLTLCPANLFSLQKSSKRGKYYVPCRGICREAILYEEMSVRIIFNCPLVDCRNCFHVPAADIYFLCMLLSVRRKIMLSTRKY